MSFLDLTDKTKYIDAKFEPVPEGKYTGKIVDATIAKNKSGHRTIKIKIKSPDCMGFIFTDLNMDHDKCKLISEKTLGQILLGAYKEPPTKIETMEEIPGYLKQAPVAVTVKHKTAPDGRVNVNVYFNSVPASEKIGTPTVEKTFGTINY